MPRIDNARYKYVLEVLMNESKTGFFRSFIYSITSFDKYRLFLRQSTGRVVAYLVLLSLVLALVTCASWYPMTSKVVNMFSEEILADVPDFKLENGKLEIYAEMPIVIDSELPVVIDTRTDVDPEKILYQYDNVILITSEKMIQKNYMQRQELSWSMYGNIEMTRDTLAEAIPLFRPMLLIIFAIIAIFFIVFFIAGKFLSALIVSLIGRAYNSARGIRLSGRNIFKISVYSMTLPLIAGTLLNILRISIPFMWVLFYVGCAVYVIGAINSIKRELDAMYAGNIDPGSFDGFGGFEGPHDFGRSGSNDFNSGGFSDSDPEESDDNIGPENNADSSGQDGES